MHAPWVVFQQRKDYKPWISKETKEIMDERDGWKKKAVELSIMNTSDSSTNDEIDDWNKYKKLRNSVTNTKKNEEYKYKKEKVEEDIGNPVIL